MLDKLQQPFANHSTPGAYFRDMLIISGLITFLLCFFQPFGIDEIIGIQRWLTGLYFGLINFAIQSVNYLWWMAFPQHFKDENWTLGKEILWISYAFLTAAFGNYLLGAYLFPEADLFQSFGPILVVSILVGLLPYLLGTYIFFNQRLKQELASALEINQQLASSNPNTSQDLGPMLPIGGEEQEFLPIHLSELLAIEAEGNYLRLFINRQGQLSNFRIRGTLKEQAQQLAPWPTLFRSHRAFIINLNQIQQVEGNAAGYRLLLHPDLPQFPVSRSQVKNFKQTMQTLNPH